MSDFRKRIDALPPEKRELLEAFLKKKQVDREWLDNEYAAPRTPVEERLAAIWGEVLKVDRVGVHDNFFKLGGDSILSIQIIAKATQAGLSLTSNQALFERPTIAELAEVVDFTAAAERDEASESRPGDAGEPFPLSPMQESMLAEIVADPGAQKYFEQTLCTLRGELDFAAFSRSWQALVERHPSLRTSFLWEGMERPTQTVLEEAALQIELEDWSTVPEEELESRLEAFLEADRERGFDLSCPPLTRLSVFRLGSDRHRVVWSSSHLVVDAWCVGILLAELFAHYDALRGGEAARLPPAAPYRRYVEWMEAQSLADEEVFWARHLRGFKEPTALGHRAEDAGETRQGHAQRHIEVSAATSTALVALAQEHGLTPHSLYLGAWALALGHLAGERRDVVFGTVLSGRPAALRGVESMVGLFINTLPVRVDIDPESALVPWVRALQERHADIQRFQHTPLGRVREWSSVPRERALFDSILVYFNAVDFSLLEAGGLAITETENRGRSNLPLAVRVMPGERVGLEMIYDREIFASGQVDAMLEALHAVLTLMVEDPSIALEVLQRSLVARLRGWRRKATQERRAQAANKLKSLQSRTAKA